MPGPDATSVQIRCIRDPSLKGKAAPSGVISAINPSDVHNAYPAGSDGWVFICFLIPVGVLRTVVCESWERNRLPAFQERVITDATLTQRLIYLHQVLDLSLEPLERQSLCLSTLAQLVQRHSTATISTQSVTRERAAVRRARELL